MIKKENVFFSVSEIMYLIIQKYQLHWTLSDIAGFLNQEKETSFYNEGIINAILQDEKVHAIISKETKYVSKLNYIFFKIKLIDPQKIRGILSFFSTYVFSKKIIFPLSLVGALATMVYSFLFYDSIIALKSSLTAEQIPLLVFVYLLYVLIILIHEFGHASAAYKYGILPRQIGFGFYFTMPVLFTELTDIWTLKRFEKILVNISGIYFQLVLNILFIALLLVFPKNIILNVLFLANSISVFYALNPFFKNDGYWVFSDYFNIGNLEIKADKCFIQLFRFLFTPQKSREFFRDKRAILIFYSFMNFLFWFYFFYKTTKYMIINAEVHYASVLHGFDLMTVGKIFLYIFFVFMFVKSTFIRVKSIIAN